jgi:hypothetical protein
MEVDDGLNVAPNIMSNVVPNITPNMIVPNVVPNLNVAPNVVPNSHVAPNVVPNPNVAPNVIPTPNVAPNLVPTPNVAPDVVPNLNVDNPVPNVEPNVIPNVEPNVIPNVAPNLHPAMWPVETDLIFVPGTMRVMLTAQWPLMCSVIHNAFKRVRLYLLFNNAFPDVAIILSMTKDSLIMAAESHEHASSIHQQLLHDKQYVTNMICLVSYYTCIQPS